ncbi:hypothetical protein [Leptospira noguchii]|uniref:hypothetical protein n=2 Tax=Leptospira noguchii TaxID=28182 RepID=UPI0015EEEFB8|nr:hypothetical protein [Leptospira noguchii]UOG32701.1 hypothetical protein MAL06_20275 [Leptospira noguchii]UOG54978.1 hypothetical protein MAL09_21925 [Leptospira noguchii]UOG55010.1 hypothetical protein MAL09_21395 [Leptospira noguchii]
MITQKITISILLIGAIFACEAKENQEMKGKTSTQKPVEITLENANSYFRNLSEKKGGKYDSMSITDTWGGGFSGTDFDDEGMRFFSLFKNMDGLHIDHTKVTDNGVKLLIQNQKLKELRIGSKGITNKSCEYLAQLENLESLYFSEEVSIDDGCIDSIIKMKKLKELSLGFVPFTRPGVERLRKARPNLSIDLGDVEY